MSDIDDYVNFENFKKIKDKIQFEEISNEKEKNNEYYDFNFNQSENLNSYLSEIFEKISKK